MTLQALADELDVVLDTVCQWQKRGMPGHKRGGKWHFDLDAVRAWVDSHVRAPKSDPRRAEADVRKATALADLRELDLAKRRGELIPRAEVREAVGTMASTLSRRLLSLPRGLAAKLEGQSRAQCEAILRTELLDLVEIVRATPYAELPPLVCSQCQAAA